MMLSTRWNPVKDALKRAFGKGTLFFFATRGGGVSTIKVTSKDTTSWELYRATMIDLSLKEEA